MMSAAPAAITLADLIERFGPVPAARVRCDPPPGAAALQDVLEIEAREDRLYELVDGVLLEKVMGFYESYLAMVLARQLGNFVADRDLGIVLGADGMVQLFPQRVRIPDVAFVRWEQLPGRVLPAEPIPQLVPDLVVEVISDGNTAEEMQQKLQDYLRAGVRLVWYVYPNTRTVRVFARGHQASELASGSSLDGGEVLPGFTLPLANLFRVPQHP